MVEKFVLKQNKYPDELNDCIAFKMELIDNKLIFHFDESGIGILNPDGTAMYPYKGLKLTYVLEEKYVDEMLVDFIDYDKFLRRNALKTLTLSEMVDYMKRTKMQFQFWRPYYSDYRCMIVGEVCSIRSKRGEITMKSFMANIELYVEKIIYEWLE